MGKLTISIRAIEKPWRTVNVITRLGNLTVRVKKYLMGFLENGMWSTEKKPMPLIMYTGDGKHTKSVAISGCYVLFLLLSTFVPSGIITELLLWYYICTIWPTFQYDYCCYSYFHYYFNGHFRNLNWRYLPYIRPIVSGLCKGIYPLNMVLYGTVPPF